MFNLKQKTMKTITIFAISMLVAVFAFAQEKNLQEVEVFSSSICRHTKCSSNSK